MISAQRIIVVFLIFFPRAAMPTTGDTDTRGNYSVDKISLVYAVETALSTHPQIQISRLREDFSLGAVLSASGQFDTAVISTVSETVDGLPERSRDEKRVVGAADGPINTVSYGAGIRKQLRSGISLSTGIDVSRLSQSGDGVSTLNNGEVNFVITQPLMRNRGRKVTTANEVSAQSDYRASQFDLRHTLSGIVRNAVVAYWTYLAALDNFSILEQSESRAKKLLEDTSTLIKNGEVPAAEIYQLEANAAQKTAARILAEQDTVEAGQSFLLALGLSATPDNLIPTPTDLFPEPNIGVMSTFEEITEWFATGLNNRDDYLAANLREESAATQLYAAKNRLKRRLDFSLDIGYDNVNKGDDLDRNLTALNPNGGGFNVGAFLTMDWPVRNYAALGEYQQQVSLHLLTVVARQDLSRTIKSSITVTLNALRNNSHELTATEKAVELFQRTLNNERQKLHLGEATFIDLISYEDRLTDVELQALAARLRYFTAVIQLRFESGLLIPPEMDEIVTLEYDRLVQIPEIRK